MPSNTDTMPSDTTPATSDMTEITPSTRFVIASEMVSKIADKSPVNTPLKTATAILGPKEIAAKESPIATSAMPGKIDIAFPSIPAPPPTISPKIPSPAASIMIPPTF